jgi:Mrp family chromosome partitioning ATPase
MSNDSPISKPPDDSDLDSIRSCVVPIDSSDGSSAGKANGKANGKTNGQIMRVSVPDVESDGSPWNNVAELKAATEERLRLLSRVVVLADNGNPFSASLPASPTPNAETKKENNRSADINAKPSAEATLANAHSASLAEDVRPFWEDEPSKPSGNRLDGVVDSILEQFPIQEPRVILFAGLSNEAALDQVAAEVARLLARRRIGKILLVDANSGTSALSQSAGALDSAGLLEAIAGREPWQAHLQTGASSGLEFLPIGRMSEFEFNNIDSEKVFSTMRSHYQFTCVSVGNFDTALASLLTNQSDGSFLLVDMSKANKTMAKQAVEKLNTAVSRVLGCIALDE